MRLSSLHRRTTALIVGLMLLTSALVGTYAPGVVYQHDAAIQRTEAYWRCIIGEGAWFEAPLFYLCLGARWQR